jgi:hypothetical protein
VDAAPDRGMMRRRMTKEDRLGPPLRDVAIGDVQALGALFAEQRARLAVVRENASWQWLGGVPAGPRAPRAVLHGLYLQLAFVALAAVALILAGFTRGPWLWAFAALAAACLLARAVILGGPVRRTLRSHHRVLLVPALVVARTDVRADDGVGVPHVHALLQPAPPTPASFAALLETAARLRRLLAGEESAPADLEPALARVRAGATAFDGGREPLPALGEAFELARLEVPPLAMPDDALTSRLVFVLVDPETRGPGGVRVAQPLLWGPGGESLYAALREQEAA